MNCLWARRSHWHRRPTWHTVAATIDAAEAAIRAAVPAAHVIYLEPDLDRAKVR